MSLLNSAGFIEAKLIDRGITEVVETGTLLGASTRKFAAMKGVRRVMTIEASRELFEKAAGAGEFASMHRVACDFASMHRVACDFGLSPIEFYHGNSADVLPRLIASLHFCPAFFFLDSHFCFDQPNCSKVGMPLWQEIDMILARNMADIIWVDDVHTFGKERPDLGQSWAGVTKEAIDARVAKTRMSESYQVSDGYVIELS